MTPEEIQFLRDLGSALQRSIAQTTIYGTFYGIFTLAFGITTTTFIHRGFKSDSTYRWIFSSSLVAYLATGTAVASSIAGLATLIRESLVQNIALPVSENQSLTDAKLHPILVVQKWTTSLLPLLALMVFIWRAWVVSPKKRTLIIFPLALWVASFAMTINYIALLTTSTSTEVTKIAERLCHVALGLSLSTNVVTTSLIGYTLLVDERFERRKLPWTRVLYLIVESGFFFICLQIIYLVLHVTKLKFSTFAADVVYLAWVAIYFSLAGIHLNAVIALVLYKCVLS